MKLDKERLIFIHIPKTAGTTLTHYLSMQFAPHETCPGQTMVDFRGMTPEKLGRFKFIKGHIFYNYLTEELSSTSHLITVLRDPVERVISLYNFWRHHPDSFFEDPKIHEHIKQGPLLARKLNLLDFVTSDSPVVKNSIANSQSRQLVKFKIPPDAQDPIIAERVISTLYTYDLVGTIKQISFFVLCLQSRFQISDWFAVEPMNIAKSSKELHWKNGMEKQQIVSTINRSNTIDRLVYDWVLSENNKRISNFLQSLVSGSVSNPLHLALLYRMFLSRWPKQTEIDIQMKRNLEFKNFFSRVLKSREFSSILKHIHSGKEE